MSVASCAATRSGLTAQSSFVGIGQCPYSNPQPGHLGRSAGRSCNELARAGRVLVPVSHRGLRGRGGHRRCGERRRNRFIRQRSVRVWRVCLHTEDVRSPPAVSAEETLAERCPSAVGANHGDFGAAFSWMIEVVGQHRQRRPTVGGDELRHASGGPTCWQGWWRCDAPRRPDPRPCEEGPWRCASAVRFASRQVARLSATASTVALASWSISRSVTGWTFLRLRSSLANKASQPSLRETIRAWVEDAVAAGHCPARRPRVGRSDPANRSAPPDVESELHLGKDHLLLLDLAMVVEQVEACAG